VPWTIDLTLVSLFAISGNCSLGYVEDNDVRYGLGVAAALHLVGRRRLGRGAGCDYRSRMDPSLPLR
jgi:hypothetical protein